MMKSQLQWFLRYTKKERWQTQDVFDQLLLLMGKPVGREGLVLKPITISYFGRHPIPPNDPRLQFWQTLLKWFEERQEADRSEEEMFEELTRLLRRKKLPVDHRLSVIFSE